MSTSDHVADETLANAASSSSSTSVAESTATPAEAPVATLSSTTSSSSTSITAPPSDPAGSESNHPEDGPEPDVESDKEVAPSEATAEPNPSQTSSSQRGVLVFSLGGALILALRNKSLSDLPRRELDGSLVVKRGEIIKSFLVQGKAVRLRRQGAKSAEAQYRWNCPQYKDCPVGYQLCRWDEPEEEPHIFLYEDMVFPSAESAIKEVVRTAPKIKVPACFRFTHGALRVAVKPVFSMSRPFAEIQEGGNVLALGVPCSPDDPEDVRGSALISRAAQHIFSCSERNVRLDWDPRVNNLVLVVKSNKTAQLHLAVERNIQALQEA